MKLRHLDLDKVVDAELVLDSLHNLNAIYYDEDTKSWEMCLLDYFVPAKDGIDF